MQNAIIANKQNQYMYCGVRLDNTDRIYSYRVENNFVKNRLKIGDVVDVPVSNSKNGSYALVEKIGFFNRENAPYPPEKTRMVLSIVTL